MDQFREGGSRRHGLAIGVLQCPNLSAEAKALACEIAGEDADDIRLEKALAIAEAQLDLKRIRTVRLHVMQNFQLETPEQLEADRKQRVRESLNRDPFGLDSDRVLRALDLSTEVEEGWRDPIFHNSIKEMTEVLRRLDRYERRALARRKRAARDLQLHDELKLSFSS